MAVIVLNPSGDHPLGFLEGIEPVKPDTFLLQGPEEPLDDPIILRGTPGG